MENLFKDNDKAASCSLFEVAADLLIKPDFLAKIPQESLPVVKMVNKLLVSVGSGSPAELEDCLLEFGVGRENKLFVEVGRLTRNLHNSLNEFIGSLDPNRLSMNTTNIPDATEKLEAVIKMTFDAANKTMDNMESQAKIIRELKSKLDNYKSNHSSSNKEDSFISYFENSLNQLDELASKTLVEQSYQDLAGQSIKKVIKLVSELQQNLISIIKVFGVKDRVEESGAKANLTIEPKIDQDDVDSLLKDLGF